MAFNYLGVETSFKGDDSFDGNFETQVEMKHRDGRLARIDRNGDGRPDEIQHFRHGIIASAHILGDSSGGIVPREVYENGELTSAEFDRDSDDAFEGRTKFDRFDQPR